MDLPFIWTPPAPDDRACVMCQDAPALAGMAAKYNGLEGNDYLQQPFVYERVFTAEQCARTLRRLRAEPARGVAIGLQTATLAGYALLCSFWSNELGGEVCIIDELFVAPSERGRGWATELVRGLCDRRLPWFRAAVAVELEVTPSNARARQLYEHLGFRAYKNALMRALPIRG